MATWILAAGTWVLIFIALYQFKKNEKYVSEAEQYHRKMKKMIERFRSDPLGDEPWKQ